jgi:hypothetical protein
VVELGNFHPEMFNMSDAKSRRDQMAAITEVSRLGPPSTTTQEDAVDERFTCNDGMEVRAIAELRTTKYPDRHREDKHPNITVEITIPDDDPANPVGKRSAIFENGTINEHEPPGRPVTYGEVWGAPAAVASGFGKQTVDWLETAIDKARNPGRTDAAHARNAQRLLDAGSRAGLTRTHCTVYEQEFDAGGAHVQVTSRLPDAAYQMRHPKTAIHELQVRAADATYISRTYNDAKDGELMAMVVPTEEQRQALRQEGYPAVTAEEWRQLSPTEQRDHMWRTPAKLTRRLTNVLRGIASAERDKRQQP